MLSWNDRGLTAEGQADASGGTLALRASGSMEHIGLVQSAYHVPDDNSNIFSACSLATWLWTVFDISEKKLL